ncbi:unnamed protein product [marine sediment metagenome]|uniref:Uncharacterized protein n=1 Tax=marine sediment metagenome TaxID=412755 RepID=X1SY57_9ZZZZ
MFQRIVKAGLNKKIPYEIRQGYGDIAMYLREKIDVVNPKPEKSD